MRINNRLTDHTDTLVLNDIRRTAYGHLRLVQIDSSRGLCSDDGCDTDVDVQAESVQ